METIKQILMRRDNMTESDADDLIQQAYEAFYDYVAAGDNNYAEDVCSEFFGLDPDYLEELLTL